MKTRKLYVVSRRKPHFYFHNGFWRVEPIFLSSCDVSHGFAAEAVIRNKKALLYLYSLNSRYTARSRYTLSSRTGARK